jgi:hypothetical protein
MKLKRPLKPKPKAIVLDADLDEAEPKPSKAKAPVLYPDGRYVEIHLGGKGIDERWKRLGPFASFDEQDRIWNKNRKLGKRVRKLRKIGHESHIGNDTKYMSMGAKVEEKKSFFSLSKFKAKKPKQKQSFFKPMRKRYPHEAQLKLKDLIDEEHYIVDIRTGFGCAYRIVPGYRLKTQNFRKKLSLMIPLELDSKVRKAMQVESGKYPKRVEVFLPPDEKGIRYCFFATPYSATDGPEKEKADPEYAKLVSKYSV